MKIISLILLISLSVIANANEPVLDLGEDYSLGLQNGSYVYIQDGEVVGEAWPKISGGSSPARFRAQEGDYVRCYVIRRSKDFTVDLVEHFDLWGEDNEGFKSPLDAESYPDPDSSISSIWLDNSFDGGKNDARQEAIAFTEAKRVLKIRKKLGHCKEIDLTFPEKEEVY